MAARLVGRGKTVTYLVILIARTVNATAIRGFAQKDANLIGTEKHVINSAHRSAKRLVIDL